MKEKLEKILHIIKRIPLPIALAVAAGIGLPVLNVAVNNRVVDKPAYHLVGRTKGIIGHDTYIRFSDGSRDFSKVRMFHSDELYQDKNGDGTVDRMYKGRKVFVRKYDYQTHKKEFDEADRELGNFSKLEK